MVSCLLLDYRQHILSVVVLSILTFVNLKEASTKLSMKIDEAPNDACSSIVTDSEFEDDTEYK